MRAAEMDPRTLYRCVCGRLYREDEFERFIDDIYAIWASDPDLSDMQDEISKMWNNGQLLEIRSAEL